MSKWNTSLTEARIDPGNLQGVGESHITENWGQIATNDQISDLIAERKGLTRR